MKPNDKDREAIHDMVSEGNPQTDAKVEAAMPGSAYIFKDTRLDPELERLQLIEKAFDPITEKLASNLKVSPGMTCLEIGPGAGSFMRWLCERVGPTGHVTAIDLDTRFVDGIKLPNLTIQKGDVTKTELGDGSYDFIHARYVLIHMTETPVLLAKMQRALKKGGVLLIEEPDFTRAEASSNNHAHVASFLNVKEAIRRLWAKLEADPALGGRLASHMRTAGFADVGETIWAERVAGCTIVSEMMKRSAYHLQSQYLATGAATEDDIKNYAWLADDPASSILYYAHVSAWGRRP